MKKTKNIWYQYTGVLKVHYLNIISVAILHIAHVCLKMSTFWVFTGMYKYGGFCVIL